MTEKQTDIYTHSDKVLWVMGFYNICLLFMGEPGMYGWRRVTLVKSGNKFYPCFLISVL